MDRRTNLKMLAALAAAGLAPETAAQVAEPGIQWVTTNQTERWRSGGELSLSRLSPNPFDWSVQLRLGQPAQTIKGFGGAVSELGWAALQKLEPAKRRQVLDALFGAGAGLNIARTPIGANDFALDWYSYDETDGDFALDRFSIARDRRALIPFIKAAQTVRPDLRLWASPWSPPTWMKTNRHYALSPSWPGQPPNGLSPDQFVREGVDAFIQEDRYLEAYARYFRRYIEAYRKEGIQIGMVMPQNEFNSAQPYPSCTWTPAGLARFIKPLAREMQSVGVDVFLGTLERANAGLVDQALNDPTVRGQVKGLGVQWDGKGALAQLKDRYGDIALWGTEQECGRGTNDWRYARYGWSLMKQYFRAGARAWNYWNLVLAEGQGSTWGWPQNSLIVVGKSGADFSLTHDYWVLRHLSAFVKPGARHIVTTSFLGYDNQLAFRNPDGEIVLVMQNDLSEPMPLGVMMGGKQLNLVLPSDSFNTIVIPASVLKA